MFGWERAAALWASRLKRSTNSSSPAYRPLMTFRATSRPRTSPRARKAPARPPPPRGGRGRACPAGAGVAGGGGRGRAAAPERLAQAVAVVYELLHLPPIISLPFPVSEVGLHQILGYGDGGGRRVALGVYSAAVFDHDRDGYLRVVGRGEGDEPGVGLARRGLRRPPPSRALAGAHAR